MSHSYFEFPSYLISPAQEAHPAPEPVKEPTLAERDVFAELDAMEAAEKDAAQKVKRKGGRPKGSKNKAKT